MSEPLPFSVLSVTSCRVRASTKGGQCEISQFLLSSVLSVTSCKIRIGNFRANKKHSVLSIYQLATYGRHTLQGHGSRDACVPPPGQAKLNKRIDVQVIVKFGGARKNT